MPLHASLIDRLTPLHNLLWGPRNAVLPVVGSGLSQGLSSWRDLLSGLIDELPEGEREGLRTELDKDKFLNVATYLEGHPTVGRARVCSKGDTASLARCYRHAPYPSGMSGPFWGSIVPLIPRTTPLK
jgi:hypothetical protein